MEQNDIREIAAHQNEVGKTQIEERIFNIRGRQVMIDRDLALLYGVETKRLNEQVKRNIERFPEDFMFQFTLCLYGKRHSHAQQRVEKRDCYRREHQDHAHIHKDPEISTSRLQSAESC